MKQFTLLVAAFLFSVSVIAQDATNITVIQRITDHSGQQIIIKKRLEPGQNLQEYIKQLKSSEQDAQEIEYEIIAPDGISGGMGFSDNHSMMYFRKAKDAQDKNCHAKKELEKMHFFMQNDAHDYHFKQVASGEKRALLGVYLDESLEGKGVKVSGLVAGGGAGKAGMKEGDVLISVNGKGLSSAGELREYLTSYKPNDNVNVGFIRDGQPMTLNVTLGEKKTDWEMRTFERDPCKVFIGIYSTNLGQGGMTISGVIPNTPAEESQLQKGDVVTALDGITVHSHFELVTERDKHQPGDYFTLSILRDGQPMDVKARFKICEKNQPQPEEATEVVEQIQEQKDEPINTVSPVVLEHFNAYPNPTVGRIQVEFKADAVPTTVRISEINGKIVFEETLNNFDGYYNRQIDLANAAPGTLTLSIKQENKMVAKNILLLNRA